MMVIGTPSKATGLHPGTRHETRNKWSERYYCPCGQEFGSLGQIRRHVGQKYKKAEHNCRLGRAKA